MLSRDFERRDNGGFGIVGSFSAPCPLACSHLQFLFFREIRDDAAFAENCPPLRNPTPELNTTVATRFHISWLNRLWFGYKCMHSYHK